MGGTNGAIARIGWIVGVSMTLALAANGCSDDVDTVPGGTAGTAGTGGTGAAAGSGGTGAVGGTGGTGGSGGSVPPACSPPDQVPDPWEVTFRPYELGTGTPVEGALVEVYDSDDAVLGSGTTDANGEVDLSIATGGTPIDGYFMASKAGYLPTRFRIQGGLGWFPQWYTMMATEAFADSWVETVWTPTSRDPDAAVVLTMVFECNKGSEAWGIPDASLAFAPAGLDVRYMDVDGGIPPGQSATTRIGQTTTANVPAGANTITLTLDSAETTYDRPMLAGTWEAIVLYPQGGPSECRPADVSGFTPEWKPSNGLAQGLCTDQQAADFIAGCFAAGATQQTCEAWTDDAANADCLACAYVDYAAPNWNAIVNFDHVGFLDHAYGQCLSAFENDLTDASCGAKVHAALTCGLTACQDGCPVEPESFRWDMGRLNECFAEALVGECSAYAAESETCQSALLGNGDPIDQCVEDPTDDDWQSTAERYIKLICGDGSD